ncbi:MAG TPA: hypothetical protein VHZ99_02790, partial [Steroidobacteraceae bacterium]|nr:hypothetical protein [Steroidobacteraceae bacterium]
MSNATGTVQWAVDGISGGNSAVGTITPNGLYKAPQVAHVATITASGTSPSFSAQASAAVTDLAAVWTEHNDNARTSQNLKEYALTPANLTSGRFHKQWSCSVDGQILAQPLFVAGVPVGSRIYNLLIVATHHDSVYAFDADDPACHVVWQTSFINGTTVLPAQTTCVDTPGEYGIQPTPVIDLASQRIYVLAVTAESGTIYQRLHALSLTTGQDAVSNIAIQATAPGNPGVTFAADKERPRAGLALSNGGVFLSWGSFCDPGSYVWHGWLMRYDAATLAQTAVFNATPNPTVSAYGGGGIWMSSGAPAIDSGGAMYLSTGNGDFNDTAETIPGPASDDFGMGVLKFDTFNPSQLSVQD